MIDRTDFLEAALDSLPDGIALLDAFDRIVFWNRAAEAITGHAGVDLLARQVPEALEPLLGADRPPGAEPAAGLHPGRGTMVRLHHKLGHDVPALLRTQVLRDSLGERIGTAALFHPAESVDPLPHGECGDDTTVEASQAEVEDRLEAAFEDFQHSGQPFGVLWITVDQAHELRKTHGSGACQELIDRTERTLTHGLKTAEEMGRWGDDEFLVLSHENSLEMLAAHAQMLAGLARTSDFRWWGDRISLTVSIGVAQAEMGESLANLLERAQAAMQSSVQVGGNHITSSPGRQSCSPS